MQGAFGNVANMSFRLTRLLEKPRHGARYSPVSFRFIA
jgi:hypothetical protein